ncbi:uncharacterized protein LOC119109206 [Pollicipes pollicipes]|uniref:uncharacterized protein LOC119109206 n=1 Tax=Pollicipes pollicipes TaxID=41117 RepID=UPI001885352E|nr:uncharacterized protein LOC119109206 [Pollicipes pollicipes]
MARSLLLRAAALLALLNGCAGIRLLRASIDGAVPRGDSLTLVCQVDPEGKKIYQAKWYKDGEEFYRYEPTSNHVFPVNGTDVDEALSDVSQVVLRGVDLDTAGKYGCEITTEGTFATVTATGFVTVVEVPKKEPYTSTSDIISRDTGDVIRINCTSEQSRPAANLTWLINNEKTGNSSITRYPLELDADGLQTVTLGLDFLLREKHFRRDQVTLKCTAGLYNVFYASTEVKVRRLSMAQRSSQSPAGQRTAAGQHSSGWRMKPSSFSLVLMLVWAFIHASKTISST